MPVHDDKIAELDEIDSRVWSGDNVTEVGPPRVHHVHHTSVCP